MDQDRISHQLPHIRTSYRTICFGLIVVEVAAIIQLATLSSLSMPLLVGVYAFAISVPLLIVVAMIFDPLNPIDTSATVTWREPWIIAYLVGTTTGAVGFFGLFFHFGVLVGSVSVAASVSASFVFTRGWKNAPGR